MGPARARIDDADYVLSLSAESLRLYPPVQGTIRRATETAEFHGVTDPAGRQADRPDRIGEPRRERFEAASEFRAERFLDNPDRQFTNAGDVLPFGAGRHHCAGSRLAGTEMVHSLQQLVRRAAWLEPQGELPGGDGLLLRSPPSLPVVLHGRAS